MNLVRTDELTKDEASRIRPVPGGPENLITANGPTEANREVSVRLGSCDSSATALVLDDSQCVLSLGRLVHDGLSFEWRAVCAPVLTNSKGEHMLVDVRDHAPHIAAPVVAKTAPTTTHERTVFLT